MKKYLVIVCTLIASASYAQDNVNEAKGVKIVETALDKMSNAWNSYKLIKHDKIEELYTLPYESYEYKKILDRYPDSLSYFIQIGEIAVKQGNRKIDNELANKITEWLSKSQTNKILRNAKIDTLIRNYQPQLKGWRMRCRISSNDKEENIEVHFDKDLLKVTGILSSKEAMLYENMGIVKNATQLLLLKEEFDNNRKE